MNIVITGSGGELGEDLIKSLNNGRHNIYLITRRKITNTKNIFILNVTLDRKLARKTISKIKNKIPKKVHKFYNLAAQGINEECQDSQLLFSKNYIITNNILEITKNLNIENFFHISSNSIFELFNDTKIHKDIYYSLSKTYADLTLQRESSLIAKNVSILRIPSIYNHNGEGRGILNVLHKELVLNNKITVYGSEGRIIDYINKRDVIKFILKIKSKYGVNIYNPKFKKIKILNFIKILIKKKGNQSSEIIFKK